MLKNVQTTMAVDEMENAGQDARTVLIQLIVVENGATLQINSNAYLNLIAKNLDAKVVYQVVFSAKNNYKWKLYITHY